MCRGDPSHHRCQSLHVDIRDEAFVQKLLAASAYRASAASLNIAQDGFVGANDVSNGHVGFKGGFCFFASSLISLRTAW
jgi:2-methylcitrate dehydratase PrpD